MQLVAPAGLHRPVVQLEHGVWLPPALYVPAAHMWHAPPSSLPYPPEQTSQSSMEVLPLEAVAEELGQAVHDPVLPAAPYVPTAQIVQAVPL